MGKLSYQQPGVINSMQFEFKLHECSIFPKIFYLHVEHNLAAP